MMTVQTARFGHVEDNSGKGFRVASVGVVGVVPYNGTH